jgi:hypothetical protein
MKRFAFVLLAVLVVTSMLAAQCGAPAEPERIVETVVVGK